MGGVNTKKGLAHSYHTVVLLVWGACFCLRVCCSFRCCSACVLFGRLFVLIAWVVLFAVSLFSCGGRKP